MGDYYDYRLAVIETRDIVRPDWESSTNDLMVLATPENLEASTCCRRERDVYLYYSVPRLSDLYSPLLLW